MSIHNLDDAKSKNYLEDGRDFVAGDFDVIIVEDQSSISAGQFSRHFISDSI